VRRLFFGCVLLAVVLCVVASLVIAAELLLRARHAADRPIYLPDDTAIARFKPGIDRVRDVQGRPVRFFTNRHGIRYDRDVAPEDADVLVLGDSNVAALFLPSPRTLAQQLARRLEPGTAVLDLGVPGFGPDQSANRFKALGPAAKAQAVVFHFFADNDFGDLLRNNLYQQLATGEWTVRDDLEREPDIFWGEYLLVQRLWSLLGLEKSAFDRIISGGDYYPSLGAELRNLEAQSRAADLLERWKQITATEYRNYRDGLHGAWRDDHYDYGIASSPHGPPARSAARILTHALREAKAAFRGADGCLVMLIQPAERDLMDVAANGLARAELARANSGYYPRALVDLAIRSAQQADVAFLDLFPVFSADPQAYYFSERELRDDDHWNSAGIGVASRVVAEYLTENRCLGRTGAAKASR
jgi:SGNH hydrolase-like domain, acetyltransferase AlgX